MFQIHEHRYKTDHKCQACHISCKIILIFECRMLLAFVSQERKLAVCLCCSKFRYLDDIRTPVQDWFLSVV